MKTNTHFVIIYRSFLLRMKNASEKKFQRKSKHVFVYPVTLFRKSCRLDDKVEKYCRAGQTTDDIMVYAHCVLHT
jgi:hypothetical protein